MPSFDGNQKGQLLTLIDDFVEAGNKLKDECFEAIYDVNKMYWWDYSKVPPISKPSIDLKPFKPRNNQLVSDISFWQIFVQYDLKNQFTGGNVVDIRENIYQNLLSGLNQMLGWVKMVKTAYLKEDIPCYQNISISFIGKDGKPIVSEDDIPNKLIAYRKTNILEPSVDITSDSVLCKVQTIFQGKKQVYFDVSPCVDKINLVEEKATNILDILNNPTPQQNNPITPVEINSTGTRQLIQAILDFQTSVTITFKKVINSIERVYGHASFILLFLREDTKKDLSEIIDDLEAIIGGNPDEIGVTSLNQIKYVWLVGSDGNYYPVAPVESTDPSNDVPLSRTNGILAGLKRADENGRWRYQRINNILYEINTNNNINKAYLDDLSPRIQNLETQVSYIETRLNQLEVKIDLILAKVNTL